MLILWCRSGKTSAAFIGLLPLVAASVIVVAPDGKTSPGVGSRLRLGPPRCPPIGAKVLAVGMLLLLVQVSSRWRHAVYHATNNVVEIFGYGILHDLRRQGGEKFPDNLPHASTTAAPSTCGPYGGSLPQVTRVCGNVLGYGYG